MKYWLYWVSVKIVTENWPTLQRGVGGVLDDSPNAQHGGRFQRSKPGLRSNWFHRQVTVIYDRLWPNSIPLKIYALHIPIHAIKVERGAQILSFYLNLIYVEEKGRVYQSGQLPYLFLSFQVFRSLPFLSHVVDYFWLRWLTSFVLTLRQDDGIFSHYNKWRCPATILKNFRFL